MGMKRIIIAGAVFSFTNISFAMADIKVVTSIKPVHSLVSGVMMGVEVPSLIIDGSGSPHTYSLKPSQAQQLQDAKLVFWVGDELETFLEGPIENIAQNATAIKLIDAHGLKKIKFREGGMFDDHGHDDHDEHDHEKHDDHDDEKHAKKEHDDHEDHDGHDDHGHGEFDPHVWLDPVNAKAIVHEIEEALVKADPEHASTYEANAHKMMDKIDSLTAELREELEPVHEKGFIVFHDAYQYFEQSFGISASGAISLGDASDPSPARLAEIRKRVVDESVECVLAEPQYNQGLVKAVVEGTNANTAVIDPLGVKLETGPNLYENLIRNLATNLAKCF